MSHTGRNSPLLISELVKHVVAEEMYVCAAILEQHGGGQIAGHDADEHR